MCARSCRGTTAPALPSHRPSISTRCRSARSAARAMRLIASHAPVCNLLCACVCICLCVRVYLCVCVCICVCLCVDMCGHGRQRRLLQPISPSCSNTIMPHSFPSLLTLWCRVLPLCTEVSEPPVMTPATYGVQIPLNTAVGTTLTHVTATTTATGAEVLALCARVCVCVHVWVSVCVCSELH